MKEAIGLIELNSIARGYVTCDAMVKKSPVELILAQTICPGKFLILISGDPEQVKEAMAAGEYYADYLLVDKILIPNLHPQVIPSIKATNPVEEIKSIAIIETFSVASTIIAADASCKAAEVLLMDVRLATGLGGKAFYTMTGELHEIQAAVAAGVNAIDSGFLIRQEIIPAPHKDLCKVML